MKVEGGRGGISQKLERHNGISHYPLFTLQKKVFKCSYKWFIQNKSFVFIIKQMCLRTWKYCSSDSFLFGSSLLFVFFKAGLNDPSKTHTFSENVQQTLSGYSAKAKSMSWFCIVCFWCGEDVMTRYFLCVCVFRKWRLTVAAESNHSTIARETRWTIVRLQIKSINNNSFHLNFLSNGEI